ncbi:alpha/beta hydrolase [Ramlibacter sp. WS9]|nr:alpha/beta hydrolase [Ramlibacter sp. WS9]
MRTPFTMTPFPLGTQDGQSALGFLFARGGEKCALLAMHPRELLLTHYLVPYVLDAGWAFWAQQPRMVGNDLRLEHETALHDVAAGVRQLRALGFEKIVLLGNSGGGGLMSFYNQQSLLAPARRIARTPGGRPTKLPESELPVADGIVLVSPHPGQGVLLLNALDPSVTDENDATSCDAALDPFSGANGFRLPPQSASYSPDFIERYRAAQHARCERIDTTARKMIAAKREALARNKEHPHRADKQIASHSPIFQVWRTDADLRCWDTSLDPSERLVGSLWGADPQVSNLGSVGFGRVVTPESWLSTWSGLTSNAAMSKTAPSIEQPMLLIEYTGDNCVFPADVNAVYDSVSSSNKQRHSVRGNHHGLPISPGEPNGQELAGPHLGEWLKATF